MIATKTISEELKEAWALFEAGQLTSEQHTLLREERMADYRRLWAEACVLPGSLSMEESALVELAEYTGMDDMAEIRKRCDGAVEDLRVEWERKVTPGSKESIDAFYAENKSYVFELIWWHTLLHDDSPLAYVSALHVANRFECRTHLDFGSGVGSGALLFARQGLASSIADIGTALLDFASWRLNKRGFSVPAFNLNTQSLPAASFDIITAMDVFEHLADPVSTVGLLAQALKPRGILLGRFHTEVEDDREYHVVRDFKPTFQALQSLGFREVWKDDWVWGHQAFQRAA